MQDGWCTIESDPGVFTELIEKIGVKDVQVEELYSMDLLKGKVYGLVFLFRWQRESDDRETAEVPGLFFARQVINNACATQALLSILLNCPDIDIGDKLQAFKEFSQDLPSDMKGLAIGNSMDIQEAHNSFARPEPFVFEKVAAKEGDEVYHFLSYIQYDGKLYELDGLKDGPILLSDDDVTVDNWVTAIRPHIEARMARYARGEIRFNLMSVIQSPVSVARERIAKLEVARAKLAAGGAPAAAAPADGDAKADADGGDDGDAMDDTPETIGDIDAELTSLHAEVEEAEQQRQQWKAENIRRKHNYVPFLMKMLESLGKHGHLVPLIEKAKAATSAAAPK